MKEELREVEDKMKISGYEEQMAKKFPEVKKDMRLILRKHTLL